VRIGGQYVGLGAGDSSIEVQKIKAFMRNKFRSYAGNLTDSPYFDAATTIAVAEMQSRYAASGQLAPGAYLSGIVNAETKYVMGYLPRPTAPDRRPVLLTVCGTGVPWWVGPDADVARAVETRYRWQPVGYPATPFPMNPSAQAGRDELKRLVDLPENQGELNLIGYSQGAIVVAEFWEYDVKPSNGSHHHRINDIRRAVTFGNPMREQGKAYPDPGAALASATSHGIADRLMVDTPDWWRNYAHHGDLYTECEGDSGEDKTAIYKIVMGTRVFSGPDSLLAQFLEIAQRPLPEAIAVFKAVIDAGMFFIKGTGPHVNYDTRPAIDYLLSA
jgi:hypothetical protein